MYGLYGEGRQQQKLALTSEETATNKRNLGSELIHKTHSEIVLILSLKMAPARRLPLTSFLVHLSSVVVTICACAALVVFVNAAFLVQTEPDDIVRQCQEEQQE